MAAAAPEFERVVRDAMDRRDLSLVALARASRIDRGRWYSWFRGENAPQPRTLARAAAVLEVPLGDLLAPYGGISESPALASDGGAGLSDLTLAIRELVAGAAD